MAGANPHTGRVEELARVVELKVELVCSDELISEAVWALKRAHTYEKPAYEVWRLKDL
ncbi:hypothetical protein [Desulfurivibrio dismutans]|uniref:hypothetical protein n=1 Tax=Desulfurivibrio dismutans TaxID=1398908 RepID=UPI0023DC34A9|nr:hypothetical protein [Desulfurivibrio alkaliphilus]MDF1614070.1 hypothetical protein [Desulfurivibrio alkaliphilus]